MDNARSQSTSRALVTRRRCSGALWTALTTLAVIALVGVAGLVFLRVRGVPELVLPDPAADRLAVNHRAGAGAGR